MAPSNGTGTYGSFTADYYTATGKLTSFAAAGSTTTATGAGNYFGAITTTGSGASATIASAPNNANLPTGYIAAFTARSGNAQFDTWTFAFKPTAAATNGSAQTLPADSTTTDYTPTAASVNKTFTATTYIGAVDPSGTDWTTGWTTNAAN
jgi:hypothetical protein